jgi:hypothetical protein
MRVYRFAFIAAALVPVFIAACTKGPTFVAKEEPWREQAERACLESTNLAKSPFLTPRSALGGPSACGAVKPYDMAGTISGRVRLTPAATLQCQMIPTVDRWVTEVVEPAALQYLRLPLLELKVAASYACRPINGISGGKLSEHGHANAIDISGFHLADGRVLTVKSGWNGSDGERAFLRSVHKGACGLFTTVLGPNANSYHHDHFHLDLARHGKDGKHVVCE